MSTILIVDDTLAFRKPIVACIRLAGYQTLEANNGREALEIVHDQHPDLILLDMAMPEMDGLGFLRARQHEAELRQIPVILLTAVTDEKYVAQAHKLGICDRLLKSQFSMQEMMRQIGQHLGTAEPGHERLSRATDRRGAPAADRRETGIRRD